MYIYVYISMLYIYTYMHTYLYMHIYVNISMYISQFHRNGLFEAFAAIPDSDDKVGLTL